MEFTGKIQNISRNMFADRWEITLSVNEESVVKHFDDIKNCEKLKVKIEKYREHRSLDANRMLWACIGDIAKAINADKWKIYLELLKRHGKYTYICVKPHMVEAMKAQWRECEEIGTIIINGTEAVQMLVYFGSSTYNTKEFSELLNGTIEEMEQMGLETPPSEDMKRALELWGKHHEKA